MTSENHPILTHHVLVVSCSCDLTDDTNRAVQDYTFCQEVAQASSMMAEIEFQCVIACIDPSKKESIDQLTQLKGSTDKNGLSLAAVSLINPIWIGNLLAQLGIVRYFRNFPNIAEIADLAASGEKSCSKTAWT